MTYYVLTHTYAHDNFDFCKIVRTHKHYQELCEIYAAIQFFWEEIDEEHSSSNPDLDGVCRILEKYFGFSICNKEEHMEAIKKLLEEELVFYFEKPKTYYNADLYEIRESMCGPRQTEKLFKKWLTKEIKEEIKKISPEE